MRRTERTAIHRGLRAVFGPSALCLLMTAAPQPAAGQSWTGYANGPQHAGIATVPSQIPQQIRWSTPVDLAPQYDPNSGDLFIHYGSPMVTRFNVVLVPVKTGASGGFRVEARRGSDGLLLWSLDSDWVPPPHNWVPPFGPVLAPLDRMLVMPGAGGTVITRAFFSAPVFNLTNRAAFYGLDNYNANPAAFNAAIQVCTPVTWDRAGDLFFGFVSNGAALPGYPGGIPSGLARISATGVGTFASAAALSGDATMKKVAYNCAPALSNDGASLYVAVNGDGGNGRLCMVDSTTLASKQSVALVDPANNNPAWVSDDSTATPTVGPDGDVFYGVLEASFPSHHARGWLLHFDAGLTAAKTPGSFGWDDSASVVPAGLVPSYAGTSKYLVLTKYNDYLEGGGDGKNKLAVLDPGATMPDPINNTTLVMKEVLTILGPTADPRASGAVREWCVNTVAVDRFNKCAVVNSEDGNVYRWDFTTNSLTPALSLSPPTGEAYTPTLIGPDGAVYAINNAKLFCCVSPGASINLGPPSGPGRFSVGR